MLKIEITPLLYMSWTPAKSLSLQNIVPKIAIFLPKHDVRYVIYTDSLWSVSLSEDINNNGVHPKWLNQTW